MKKIILLVIVCMILLIGTVSAAFPYFNIKTYNETTKTATIKNWFGFGTEVATIKLTYNTDYCLINCEATMLIDLNTETKGSTLFERVRFFDTNNKLKEIKSYEIWVKGGRTEVSQTPIYEEACSINENLTESCEWKVKSYKNETVEVDRWELFNGDEDYFGELQIKIKGKKSKDENIEWIPTYLDNDIDEWDWWDANWEKKKQINISENSNTDMSNYTVRMTVAYDSDMQSDFGDLRFVNGSENTELGYYIINKTNSNHAVIDVFIDEGLKANTNTTTYMYYDTSGTTLTTSEGEEAYNFYDNFSIDSRTTKWTMFGGDSEINNSMLRLNLTGGDKHIYTQFSMNVSDGWVVRFEKFINIWSVTAGEVMEWGIGITPRGDDNLPHMDYYRDGTPIRTLYYGNSSDEESMTHKFNETANEWVVQELLYTPTNYTWFENSVTNWTNGTLVNSNFFGAGFKNELMFRRAGASPARTEELYIANVSMRRFTRPEPTVIFGVEEINPLLTLVVTLDDPSNNTASTNISTNFSSSNTVSAGYTNNATLFMWNSNHTLYKINSTNLAGVNYSNLSLTEMPLGKYFWNTFYCVINATGQLCNMSIANYTFSMNVSFDTSYFAATTFEGQSKDFEINISSPYTPVQAQLNYNGTNTNATITAISGTGNQFRINKTLVISELAGEGSKQRQFYFHFNVTNTFFNSSFTNQTVSGINFTLCDGTINTVYINFTFFNETTAQESVNALFSSEFTYWTTNQSANNTYSYTNTTKEPSQAFCFSPPDTTVNVEIDSQFSNSESQQRNYAATVILTNTTTNQVLWLLPTSKGLFSPFQTVTAIGDPISLVEGVISRTIGGTLYTIVSDFTDSSGFVNYFLNPDFSYSATFSRAGFNDNTFIFVPTTDRRLVTMGTGAEAIGNGTVIARNTTYTVFPLNRSLNNNTDYTFALHVNSTQAINFISMNITNKTGGQLSYQTAGSAGAISDVINTVNMSRIIGYYVIKTSSETLSFTNIWTVGIEFVGEYSIYRQFTLFLDYEFKDFTRLLIVLIIITGVMIFITNKEIIDTSESKVAIIVLMIWAFSIVGWLNTGLSSYSATGDVNELAKLGNQYGIAILSTCVAMFFILRRLFIRRI